MKQAGTARQRDKQVDVIATACCEPNHFHPQHLLPAMLPQCMWRMHGDKSCLMTTPRYFPDSLTSHVYKKANRKKHTSRSGGLRQHPPHVQRWPLRLTMPQQMPGPGRMQQHWRRPLQTATTNASKWYVLGRLA